MKKRKNVRRRVKATIKEKAELYILTRLEN